MPQTYHVPTRRELLLGSTALVAGAQYSHERLMEIWDDVRPDAICTDNVTGYPAVELAGCPWARFVSANPLEMRDPDVVCGQREPGPIRLLNAQRQLVLQIADVAGCRRNACLRIEAINRTEMARRFLGQLHQARSGEHGRRIRHPFAVLRSPFFVRRGTDNGER